jgi:hypothetical protein
MKIKNLIDKINNYNEDIDIFFVENIEDNKTVYYFDVYENKIGDETYYTIEKLEDNENTLQQQINDLEDKYQYSNWKNYILLKQLNGENLEQEELDVLGDMLKEHNRGFFKTKKYSKETGSVISRKSVDEMNNSMIKLSRKFFNEFHEAYIEYQKQESDKILNLFAAKSSLSKFADSEN